MAGDAYDTIQRFWSIQDAGDYTATVELFADDAVLEDPLYGTYEGKPAIAGFMATMNEAVAKVEGSFRLIDLAGGADSAWAQWEMTTVKGTRTGVGVYRVGNSKITYYRDYLDPE